MIIINKELYLEAQQLANRLHRKVMDEGFNIKTFDIMIKAERRCHRRFLKQVYKSGE